MPSNRARKVHRRMNRRKKIAGPKPQKTPFVIDPNLIDLPRLDLPPADAELDQLLTDRGWELADRHPDGDMYDWPASVVDPAGRYLYVIVGGPSQDAAVGHRYRAGIEGGTQGTFSDRRSLIAELDNLEALYD